MAFVDWNELYSVKSETLDHQHQKMFQIVNHLHEAIFSRKAKGELEGVIKDLVEYTRTHFAEEERQMEQHHFPEALLLEHKAVHQQLVRQVEEMEKRFHNGDRKMAADVMCFLVGEWLLKHILVMDKQYAPYMKGANAPERD
jgi:hemerythrin